MNRKRLLLAALGGLLVLSLVYAFWAMPRQEQAPPRSPAPRPAAKAPGAGKAGQATPDRLHLGLLAQAPQPFPGAGRDIFRFGSGRAAPVETPLVMTAPEKPVPPPPPPPPATPEELLREQVARFTFLGFLDKGGVKTVFLSSAGELLLIKAGDRFGKSRELLAQEISATELVVRAADGPETVRVRLVENEALKPQLIGARAAGGGSSPGDVRQGGPNVAPQRRVLGRRKATQPGAEGETAEEVQQDVHSPVDGVKQEEPPKNGLPGGEGNGNTE